MYRSYEEMPKLELPQGQKIKVSDSTIRDGAQMPGIVMTRRNKLEIYEYLSKIGIEKMECFLYNDRDKLVAREMLDRGYEFPEVTGWARAREEDIDLVLAMDGMEETGILMSVSDSHMFDKIGFKNAEEAESRYLKALDYALDHGLRVRCHLEDMTRADFDFLLPFTEKIMERSPDAVIRLCDTLGLGVPFNEAGLPYGIPRIVQELKKINVRNIETHVHDDFGLGIANSLSAYWHGANWSNLTFLGIGERAGNAELEKILLFFAQRVKGFRRYNLEYLVEFARYMEKEVRVHVPRNKAVVGDFIFAHESGIHTAGVIKNPFTYESFPPELVGGERKLMVGDSSGTAVIMKRVEEVAEKLMGIKVSIDKRDSRITAIHRDIHKLYDKEGRTSCISDDEMKKYVEKYFMFQPVVDEVAIENSDNGSS